MTHEEAWALLGAQFEADGIVDMHPDEFIPPRVAVPPVAILHRVPTLARLCQELRTASAASLFINSAYRDPVYNERVGGAKLSQHPQATAADLVSIAWKPDAVADWLEAHRLADFLGVGRYDTFTHVDVRGLFPANPGAKVRPAPARWDNRSSTNGGTDG